MWPWAGPVSNLRRTFMRRIYPALIVIFQLSALNEAKFQSFQRYPKNSIVKGHECNSKSFVLYDGYILVDPSSKSTIKKLETNSLQECLSLCRANDDCESINYDGNSCQHIEQSDGYLERSDGESAFNIHAHKICITDKRHKCQDRLWAWEHIIGYHIIAYPSTHSSWNLNLVKRKEVNNVQGAIECFQLCIQEESFECRSAQYNASNTNCVLLNLNRHTIDASQAESSRDNRLKFMQTVPFSEEIHYMENKCISEPKKFCDFRHMKNKRLRTVDSVHVAVQSESECREICLESTDGQCRSYDYELDSWLCRLSHLSELSSLHIKRPYLEQEGVTTSEIATCYNVSIFCESKAMKVQIETSQLFNGRIYAKQQPKKCVQDVTNGLSFSLSLPYIDFDRSINESSASFECGTRQADKGSFANDIVIQHHDLVLTTKDLSLGVFCKFDLQNDSLARIDLKIQGDILTDKLQGHAKLPELSLHVVDGLNRDMDEVTIGDILRVQIRMSDESTYGIFVRNLVAKDSTNQTNSFTLIDGKGCPVQMKMMREVRTLDSNSKSLESYLEAFAFTAGNGGSLLIIDAEVETCLDKCRPTQCQVATGRSDDALETITSYGRRRRRSIVTELEQAEKGDVLSMTMLSKAILIRADDVTPLSSTSGEPQATANVSTQNKSDNFYPKHKKHHAQAQPFHENKRKGDLVSGYMRVSMANQGFICFEPLNLFIICALTFCVQGFVFTVLFCAILRYKTNSGPPTSASSPQPTSQYFGPSYRFMR